MREDIPDQNLAKTASATTIDKLLRIGELDVHVGVDADEATFVLCLAPFQPDKNILVNAIRRVSIWREDDMMRESWIEGYK